MLACPRCHAALAPDAPCPGCGASYPTRDGVLDAFVPDAHTPDDPVTAQVSAFYEARPFPDYRDDDDRGSLSRRGRANGFTRALDQAIPPGAHVVELGCGTGQLPLFLSLAQRTCLGVDLSHASLATAEAFRQRAGLDGVRFVRGNLFAPPVAPESADVGISTGVLHHTADPRRGFEVLTSLVRPGGHVVVGLYNRWGRLLLPMLRRRHKAQAQAGGARAQAWFHDQHRHPHESRHTVDEVLGWFDAAGLAFVSASPPITAAALGGLFTPTPRGTWFEHAVAQAGWLGRAADGGLWVMVGRKP